MHNIVLRGVSVTFSEVSPLPLPLRVALGKGEAPGVREGEEEGKDGVPLGVRETLGDVLFLGVGLGLAEG